MKLRRLKKLKPRPEIYGDQIVRRGLRIRAPRWGKVTLHKYVLMPAEESTFSPLMKELGMQPSKGSTGGVSMTIIN